MNNPQVSVIIPLYKVEEYLRECLDSVVNQTMKDIEIICVDDGSPDRSADIAAEYVEKYDNFKLIRKENGGLSSARNSGLDAATGEYVYFLDSDDYVAANMFESLYQAAGRENLDIVYFNTNLVFANDIVRNKNQHLINYYSRESKYSGVCSGQTMFTKMRLDGKFLPSACLQLFRREFIEQHHFRFYTGILHEDNLFSFQCAMTAKKVDYLPDKFYFRRVHDDSITTSKKTIRHVEGYIVSYSEALHFLHGIEIQEDAASHLSEYLYWSLYRNACNIWSQLDESEKNRPLAHGGVCADHIFSLIRRNMDMERQMKHLKYKTGNAIKCDTPFRAMLGRLLPGKLGGFFQCASEYGYRYTIRRTFQKGYAALCSLPLLLKKPGLKLRMKFGGKQPLISFILPVYNVEEFLPQCLDALIAQSMPHIEIICVDDGSTDRSLEILNQYAARDSRIRVFTQKNQYAGVARNLGLSKATGEYVAFLDSDDFFSTDLAKETYYAAKLRRADIVLFGAKHFDNATKKFKDAPWLFHGDLVPPKQPFSYRDCPNLLYQITTACPWTKLFRREFVLKYGLQFQALRNSNDVFFTFSALAMAERIAAVHETLVFYRVGMANNLQATKSKNPLCFYEAYQALHDKLDEIGCLDTLRQSYVNVVLGGCLYNLRSQKNLETKITVCNALKNSIFSNLELIGHPKAYYYIDADYVQLQNMVHAYISFSDFEISRGSFSCNVKSSLRGETDKLTFTLSPDLLHIGNDAIAATLATMCGQTYERIDMDLEMSDQCMEKIQAFTGASVKSKHLTNSTNAYPAIVQGEQNLPESYILNFSGGFDSLAAVALLPSSKTVLVSVDFGGWFERETDFFKNFDPKILHTNFRQLKYDREHWTFMGAGALLYAESLGVKHHVFGTILEAMPSHFWDTPPSAASTDTLPFSIVGLKDIRLMNGLTEVATAMIVTKFYPHMIADSLKSLAAPNSEKRFRKQLLTEIVCKRFNRVVDLPECPMPADNQKKPFGQYFAMDFLALYELKHRGIEDVLKTVADIPEEAIDLVEKLSLEFYERLNPIFLETVPADIRGYYLDRLNEADVIPYTEKDWEEFRIVRDFLSKYHPDIAGQ